MYVSCLMEGKVFMFFKEKLHIIKNGILNSIPTEKALPTVSDKGTLVNLDEIDDDLDLLLQDENGSLAKEKTNYLKDVIRLIILLDISGSMRGTEHDIYLGLKSLIDKHKNDSILLNFIAFNDDRYELLDDIVIGDSKITPIGPVGGTDLNGSLDFVLREKCKMGVNLLVTISDGADTENKVSAANVKKRLKGLTNEDNHFYFIGEPNEYQKPEDVYKNASQLGFDYDHVAVFTREGNGNKLNFLVISEMLDELIYSGKISPSWANPIKEHYLALTDKRS